VPQYYSQCQSAATSKVVKHYCASLGGVISNSMPLPYDQAFTVAGPRAWNNLSDAIRPSSSLATFKCSLKTYLFLQRFLLLSFRLTTVTFYSALDVNSVLFTELYKLTILHYITN